jgi:hypothetical protein
MLGSGAGSGGGGGGGGALEGRGPLGGKGPAAEAAAARLHGRAVERYAAALGAHKVTGGGALLSRCAVAH